jgi:excisionase family DNA binding protein
VPSQAISGPVEEFGSNQGPPAVMTAEEVAAYLKTSKKTAYKLIRSGAIASFRIGKQWRVTGKALTDWIAKQLPAED